MNVTLISTFDKRYSATIADRCAALGFFLLYFTLLVGSAPLSAGSNATDPLPTALPSWYVLASVLAYSLSALTLFFRPSIGALKLIPTVILILVAWSLLSVLWSDFPGIALNRAVRMTLLVVCVAVYVNQLGAQRCWEMLGLFLSVLILVNWVALGLSDAAVHGINEIDPRLAGDWRGIHGHKNVTAPIMFLAAAHTFLRWRLSGSRIQLGLFALAVIFIIGTNSRTSLAATAMGFLVLIAAHTYKRRPDLVSWVSAMSFVFVGAVAFLVVKYSTLVEVIFDDNYGLSGRSFLWKMLLTHLDRVFYLGTGFGSFWRVGVNGPSFLYAYTGWFAMSYNGHNGYLDIFVTLGLVGFLLALWAAFLTPFIISRTLKELSAIHCMSLCTIVFSALHNLLETSFLLPSGDVFMLWLLSMATLMYKKTGVGESSAIEDSNARQAE
jgi:exopolysaccharide production protein ExoQ